LCIVGLSGTIGTMKRSEILFSTLLVPLDLVALISAFIISYRLRNSYTLFAPDDFGSLSTKFNYTASTIVVPFSQYLHYLAVIIPVMLLIFAFTGLYQIRLSTNWFQRIVQILIGVSMGECFILLLFLLRRTFFIPRATVIYSWILSALLVILVRLLVRGVQKILYSRNIGVINVGVIGKNIIAERIIAQLSAKSYSAYRLVLHLDSIDVAEIVDEMKKQAIDELIIVSKQYNNDDLIALRNHCLEQRISFSLVPPLLTELQSVFEVRSIGRLPLIEVRPTPLEGWGRVIKRAFDILASLVLIVLFSPVYLVIALLIQITDPGPMIYRHRRIGKDEAPIDVWKFRSMRWEYCTGPKGHPKGDSNMRKLLASDADLAKEWQATFKLKNDPRISGVGLLLRKTSLDELPQFFNVLGGSLSLVGPRPIVAEEVEKYGEKARILFTVKPGVTGLWQVSGRSNVSYEERIALDSRYIEHWSLWSDIVISCKTAFVLLDSVIHPNKRGAY
jgi:exopolysaccharide biosynthesis polyprenyl glycosylphosphotransferase